MEGTASRPPKARVFLTPEQRDHLQQIARNGKGAAKRIMHARVLLMADEAHADGQATDAKISRALGVAVKTVARIRQRFLKGSLTVAVERKARITPPVAARIDGRAEARLIAICCSPPPAGRARWTMQLLTEELINRSVVVSICKETVRKTLKKTSCIPGV